MRAVKFISISGCYFASIENPMLLKNLIVVNFFLFYGNICGISLHHPPEYLRLLHQTSDIIRFINTNCKPIAYNHTR